MNLFVFQGYTLTRYDVKDNLLNVTPACYIKVNKTQARTSNWFSIR